MGDPNSDVRQNAPEASAAQISPILGAILRRLRIVVERWHSYGHTRENSVFEAQAQTVLAILRDAPLNEPEITFTTNSLRALQNEYPALRGTDGLGHYVNQAVEHAQRKR